MTSRELVFVSEGVDVHPQFSLGEFVKSGQKPDRVSYLGKYRHNCTSKKKIKWSNGQKRCFFRIKSGCVAHKGKILRFMTLTSSQSMNRTMSNSFRALKERIRRKTPYKLFEDGYISKNRLAFYYPDRRYFKKLDFEYIKVETKEGVEGVFHVCYFGSYIPQRWLSESWFDITGSDRYIRNNVDIRQIKNRHGLQSRVANYVINQYIVSQTSDDGVSAYVRFSNSWNWCFRGFIGQWNYFKSLHRQFHDYDKIYTLWDKFVWNRCHPPPTQSYLDFDYSYLPEQDYTPIKCEDCPFIRSGCYLDFWEDRGDCIYSKKGIDSWSKELNFLDGVDLYVLSKV